MWNLVSYGRISKIYSNWVVCALLRMTSYNYSTSNINSQELHLIKEKIMTWYMRFRSKALICSAVIAYSVSLSLCSVWLSWLTKLRDIDIVWVLHYKLISRGQKLCAWLHATPYSRRSFCMLLLLCSCMLSWVGVSQSPIITSRQRVRQLGCLLWWAFQSINHILAFTQ